ncbi:MAG TPA: asparagine synthase-related protein, partial [Candidatus Paceibacterota bacterium]
SRIPDSLKYKDGATKHILRKAFASILPKETASRKKLGFPTPIRQWIKNKPGEVSRLILENAYIKEKFDTDHVKALLRNHISGKRDNARKIYTLLMLALWYNIFIEKKR